MEFTYEQVKKLIISEEVEGTMIKLKLKASNQETPIETVAVVTPDPEEIKKKAMKQAGKSMVAGAGINMASNAVGNAIGGLGGQLAKSAGNVASSKAASGMMNMDNLLQVEMNDENKQKAILTAFSHLKVYYEWNGSDWTYNPPQQ